MSTPATVGPATAGLGPIDFVALETLVRRALTSGIARIAEHVGALRACDPSDPLQARIFADYGAMFVAGQGATAPPQCVFANEEEVQAFQATLQVQTERVGGVEITLQAPAMRALLDAIQEANRQGLRITPASADTAAKRSYRQTVSLWRGYLYPALDYWARRGRLTRAEVRRAKDLAVREQVLQVLQWEARGLYCSPSHAKSILYVVAAPGTSQHLSMLALDVRQHGHPKVREILARHGWFRTIRSDVPHFTFLGRPEAELDGLGLQPWQGDAATFWIPDTPRLLAVLALTNVAAARLPWQTTASGAGPSGAAAVP